MIFQRSHIYMVVAKKFVGCFMWRRVIFLVIIYDIDVIGY